MLGCPLTRCNDGLVKTFVGACRTAGCRRGCCLFFTASPIGQRCVSSIKDRTAEALTAGWWKNRPWVAQCISKSAQGGIWLVTRQLREHLYVPYLLNKVPSFDGPGSGCSWSFQNVTLQEARVRWQWESCLAQLRHSSEAGRDENWGSLAHCTRHCHLHLLAGFVTGYSFTNRLGLSPGRPWRNKRCPWPGAAPT